MKMMNVDVPAVFDFSASDYHDFRWLQQILVETVGLAYEYEEIGCDGEYHAVYWAGDRPAEYIDGAKADFDEE